MLLISAFKKYFALDPKQKEFIRSSQRIFLCQPEELLKFLRPLANFDKDCDGARRQCGYMMIASFIIGIISMILIGNELVPAAIGTTLLFLMIAWFFVSLILYFILGRIDIHNNLREFVVPLVNAIGQDMKENEKMKLKIDLRGKCIPSKQIKKDGSNPGWFSYPKVTRTFFRDPWLDGSAVLCDGSKMFFSVTDMIVQTKRTKKNPRGKIKTKTKVKIKSKIRVGLALKNKTYQIDANDRLRESGDRVKQKQNDKRNIFSLTRIEHSTDIDKALDPVSMLAMIGKIFMSVRPAAKKG
ncbi:MAG: hypothetical protein Kow0029_11780 [Candidatus Rifleibacteriota bacterium]